MRTTTCHSDKLTFYRSENGTAVRRGCSYGALAFSKQSNRSPVKLAAIPRDYRSDVPLRAQSVNLAERPRSNYARTVRSADPNRHSSHKQFFAHRPPSVDKKKPKPNKVLVKQQKRKVIEKVPCAISVQNLSIPMKYADNHSTSTQNFTRIDSHNRTKSSNPPKQVGEKRLCQSVGGKETENKLLVQISEAEQVSDFERILNSNAILCERARGHVWRGSVAAQTPTASALRPRSTYSLRAVSQAYHYLFRQHEDSLQPLIDHYRQTLAVDNEVQQHSLIGNNWDTLNDLQEFYEDDHSLKKEIEQATDQLITEEIQVEEPRGRRQKNFNVNLAGLIDLHVTGEGYSPVPAHELDPSPDARPGETDDEEEWLAPIMSATDDQQDSNDSVDCLAQNLNGVKLGDAKVPTITFSNCSDGSSSELPNNKDVVIHLAVPSIDCIDETRPPIM